MHLQRAPFQQHAFLKVSKDTSKNYTLPTTLDPSVRFLCELLSQSPPPPHPTLISTLLSGQGSQSVDGRRWTRENLSFLGRRGISCEVNQSVMSNSHPPFCRIPGTMARHWTCWAWRMVVFTTVQGLCVSQWHQMEYFPGER